MTLDESRLTSFSLDCNSQLVRESSASCSIVRNRSGTYEEGYIRSMLLSPEEGPDSSFCAGSESGARSERERKAMGREIKKKDNIVSPLRQQLLSDMKAFAASVANIAKKVFFLLIALISAIIF